MESSRTLVTPGLRTLSRPRLRTLVGAAAGVVLGRPRLWISGMLGFALRGGIVVLTVPIVVLPTQVEARLLLGSNLDSSGFTDGFWGLVAAATLLTAVIAIVVVATLARLELSSFEQLTAQRELTKFAEFAPLRSPPAPRDGEGRRSRALAMRLFTVQSLTLIALLACAVPLATAIGQAAFEEVVRPSSGVSIYSRVLGRVGQPLYLFAAAVIGVELLSSLVTREVLVRSLRAAGPSGQRPFWLPATLLAAFARLLRKPARAIGTALCAWFATVLLLVPGLVAIVLAWETARSAFLTSVSFADLADNIGMGIAALALSAAFCFAVLLAGLASAFRSALWSLERLS